MKHPPPCGTIPDDNTTSPPTDKKSEKMKYFLKTIKEMYIFSSLTPPEMEGLLSLLCIRYYQKGELIASDLSSIYLVIIVNGSAEIWAEWGKSEKNRLAGLSRKSYICMMDLPDAISHELTLRATSKTTALFLERETIHTMTPEKIQHLLSLLKTVPLYRNIISDQIIKNLAEKNKLLTGKLAEQPLFRKELKKARTLFQAVIEHSRDAVLILDQNLILHAANASARTLLHLNKDQSLNIPIRDIPGFTPKESHSAEAPLSLLPLERSARDGETVLQEEHVLLLPDGEERRIILSTAPVRIRGTGIIAIIAVIIDAEEENEIELKNIEFLNRLHMAKMLDSISNLAGGIAHEFNNALFEITGNTQLLEMSILKSSEAARFAEAIKFSAQKMAWLTRQLLAYSRGGRYNPKNTRLGKIVSQLMPGFIKGAGPEIRIRTGTLSDSYMVEVDSAQIKNVIAAIISNSLESIETEGDIIITTRNKKAGLEFTKHRTGMKPGKYACLEVKDTGQGMEPIIKDKIFEPFFTTNFTGRGLGMAAVYGIIKNHKGWIGIESRPQKGTKVSVYLPAAEPRKKTDPGTWSDKHPALPAILFIGDRSALAGVCRDMIEYLGYATIKTTTGQESLNTIRRNGKRIDLVMIDCDLPHVNWKELYKLIKKENPSLKILLSSSCGVGEMALSMNLPADHFIQKPYPLTLLSKKLKAILKGTRPGVL